jgi:hypothetical protein
VESSVTELPIPVLAFGIFSAIMYAMYLVKRIWSFDLELRTERQKARRRYAEALNNARIIQDHYRELRAEREEAARRYAEIMKDACLIQAHLSQMLITEEQQGIGDVRPSRDHKYFEALIEDRLATQDYDEYQRIARHTISQGTLSSKQYRTLRSIEARAAVFGISRAQLLGANQAHLIGISRAELLNITIMSPEEYGKRLRAQTQMPPWALALLSADEATRCAQEWTAHLYQQVQEGEIREASIDRKRLARRAVVMAVTSRIRTAGLRLRRVRR